MNISQSLGTLLILSSAVIMNAQTLPATAGPQAVKYILKHFTINGQATDPKTHQPLRMDGTWSVNKNPPASCSPTAATCVEVFYQESTQAAKCSWIVALDGNGSDGTVLDENQDAAKYMLRAVSGKEAKPFVISRNKPQFPPIGAALGARGPVTIWALVDTSGRVQNAGVASGPAVFQGASVAAAKKWQFKPMVIGNQAVPYEVQLEFTFLPLTPTSGYVQVAP